MITNIYVTYNKNDDEIYWYLKKTTPEFSISDEARVILEEGLEKKYPELFQRVKEEMSQS